MKRILVALTLSCSAFSALGSTTISSLATDQSTQETFRMMTNGHMLPSWIVQGGTNSQNQNVTISGQKYIVLNSCKPHDCTAESMAILYSPEKNTLSGVFSQLDAQTHEQKLTWLNINDELSIDSKTVLFAALTGSLDNHPDSFNFN